MAVVCELGRAVVVGEAVHLEDEPLGRPGEVDAGDERPSVHHLQLTCRFGKAGAQEKAEDLGLGMALDRASEPRP